MTTNNKFDLASFRTQMLAKAKAKAEAMNQSGLEEIKAQLLEKKQELAGLLELKKEVLQTLQSNPLGQEYAKWGQQVQDTESQARKLEAEIMSLAEGGEVGETEPVKVAPSVVATVPEGGKSTDGEEFSVGDEGQFILVIDEDSEVDVEFYINGNWESSKLPAGYEPKWYRIAGR